MLLPSQPLGISHLREVRPRQLRERVVRVAVMAAHVHLHVLDLRVGLWGCVGGSCFACSEKRGLPEAARMHFVAGPLLPLSPRQQLIPQRPKRNPTRQTWCSSFLVK